MTGFLRLKQSQ